MGKNHNEKEIVTSANDPAITLLGVYPKEIKTYVHIKTYRDV